MAVQFDINYIAVLVSAIVAMVIGALWYSPILFGKAWMRLTGMSKEQLSKAKQKGMTASYAVSFLALLVMAFVLAHFVDMAQATTVVEGAQAGFWAWLGFIATTMIGIILWENKPVKLYILNVAHYFVVLIVMGAILAVWA